MTYFLLITLSLILIFTKGQETCTVGSSCEGSNTTTYKRCCVDDYFASTVITCSPAEPNHIITSSDRCEFGCFAGECISSSLCSSHQICNITRPSNATEKLQYDFPTTYPSFCCGDRILNTCNTSSKRLTSSLTCQFGCSQYHLKCFQESETGSFCYSDQQNVTNPPKSSTKCIRGQTNVNFYLAYCQVEYNVSRMVALLTCPYYCNPYTNPQRCFLENEVGSLCPIVKNIVYCIDDPNTGKKMLKDCSNEELNFVQSEELCEYGCQQIEYRTKNSEGKSKLKKSDSYECEGEPLTGAEIFGVVMIGVVSVCCVLPCVIICVICVEICDKPVLIVLVLCLGICFAGPLLILLLCVALLGSLATAAGGAITAFWGKIGEQYLVMKRKVEVRWNATFKKKKNVENKDNPPDPEPDPLLQTQEPPVLTRVDGVDSSVQNQILNENEKKDFELEEQDEEKKNSDDGEEEEEGETEEDSEDETKEKMGDTDDELDGEEELLSTEEEEEEKEEIISQFDDTKTNWKDLKVDGFVLQNDQQEEEKEKEEFEIPDCERNHENGSQSLENTTHMEISGSEKDQHQPDFESNDVVVDGY